MNTIEKIYSAFELHKLVSTDTRNIASGAIFFALHGANFDGNKFVLQALASGAEMVVGDNKDAIIGLGDAAQKAVEDGKIILVDDVLQTLQQLAKYHRRKLGIPVLAITGSNGKTTTKELVARVLAKRFKISVTEGNLNNHIGVPLTLLKIDSSREFAIVEMGANHLGEIELLASIAEPNFGLITNIGKAHLEGFGSQSGVRRGKGELADFLEASGGQLFYLSDSDQLRTLVCEHPLLKSLAYTTDGWQLHKDTYVSGTFDGHLYKSHLTGDYNIYNIAAAHAVGRFFGIDSKDITSAIDSYHPDNNRSQRVEGKDNTIICDAYNANPSSMTSAIDAFMTLDHKRSSSALILGGMLELGSFSGEEHRAIYDKVCLLISQTKLSRAYFVGSGWNEIKAEKNRSCLFFEDTAQLCKHLENKPIKDHILLIKGSRSIGLEKIYGLLVD